MKNRKGFTVLELMVAMAVLGVMTSQTSQVITRTRITANEGGTLGNLQALRNGFEMFRAFNLRYPNSLAELNGYVDRNLMDGQKHGYTLQLSNASQTTYTVTAVPTQPGLTGIRTFILDESGTIQPFDGRTLTGSFNRVGSFLGWQVLAHRVGQGTFSIVWKFTNTLGRALKDVILAIDNIRFGGSWLGSKLLADGEIPYSAANPSRTLNYYRLGPLSAGASAVVEETFQTPRGTQGGAWYARSFSFWESRT